MTPHSLSYKPEMPSTKLQTDLSSLITTGLDESQIGDVLLFISPESEGYQDTRIVSAFSHTTYYTITADANGFNTNVYRGDAKGSVFKGIFSHIATVSRASGHRVWESNERNRWESKEGEEGSELDEKVDIEDKEVHPQESEEGGRKHRRTSSNAQLGGANTLSLGIQSQNDVFLIEYGKGASKALRECVKIEKGT